MHPLTREELASVTTKSDFKAWRVVVLDWFIIVAALIMAGASPNLLTLSLALALIGCRQLSLGIIVHETGHQTFFKSRALNDFVGRWLSGYWVFSSKKSYMEGHLKHHQYAGTPNDPDLKNYAAYPVSKSSFRRKVWRDLSGKTGYKATTNSSGSMISSMASATPSKNPSKGTVRTLNTVTNQDDKVVMTWIANFLIKTKS